MPLTDFQKKLLAVLAPARTPESYLAGGAALHFAPNSVRFSHDLDLFHDRVESVARAFAQDQDLLAAEGYGMEVVLSQPGHIRAVVRRDAQATLIDWAHDSSWRFTPLVRDELGGYLLHEMDLAVNKTLVLAGRDEIRDFVDILYVHERILPLGAAVWAAVGKDPGFTPLSLLEQLRRRGRYRQADVERLDLACPFDLIDAKGRWLAAMADAEAFVLTRPPSEAGCLYYAPSRRRFEAPGPDAGLEAQGLVVHFVRPGGVLPRPSDQRLAP